MSDPTASERAQEDRRLFLKTCGRFAGTIPPAMVMLLSTSLSSEAIAKSSGGHGYGRDKGSKPGNGPKPGKGPKSGKS